MRRLLCALWLSLPSTAVAEAALVSSGALAEPGPRVDVWAGIPELGVGYLATTGWSGDLAYFPGDAVIELRGGRSFQLVRWPVYSLAAGLSASVLTTHRGPLDLGMGPHGSLMNGWRWRHFVLELGAQAGAQLFVRTGGPRFPLRAVLAAGPRFHTVETLAVLKGGADLEPGYFFALRYEALLWVRWAQ